ncbi:prepilin-type N-terminal cleavage/methylation domain-containing protein [Streptococcus sanguinis]|uniref:prepilin-type N-terminal cleavage/methylation domain-containing protein n=1 Tax=Streptococcus sanguinis TaxID=1305 RepID=UPI002283685C|nr:prepilin-type N-terminal cleavage/methylation domain-containing protein [Streptococcus sanguinis]MCY7041923.1 prepilin-type N-terminal cleavage/methylation domain-containing protein [Streptococcus sanguinis]
MLNKLQKFRQDLKKKGKGFTLVELIVVIIIIAIIAAVAIPAITSFQDNARKSRIQSEHRELVSAIQSYIGAQDDPSNPTSPTLQDLAPYISKNAAKKDASTLVESLAKNGKDSAHTISGTKLTSTFIPAGKTSATDSGAKTWEYDWSSAGVNAN